MNIVIVVPVPWQVDLSGVGGELCHTIDEFDRTLCGMGVDDSPIHYWVDPVDGVCPKCGKKTCPTCDLMSNMDADGYLGRK